MTIITKKLKHPLSETPTFEEVYKTSYSHGLEQIYKLETVDAKSIRVLGSGIEKTKEPQEEEPSFSLPCEDQMEFPFPGEGKSSIDSFLVDEPISVLGLSKHAENTLKRLDIGRIQDLLDVKWKNLAFGKGIGQGHIEEINEKLREYIFGKPLQGCLFIDFESLTKVLLPEGERKKSYIALESCKLNHLISLSPLESVEIRKLTIEKKQEWLEEGKKAFKEKKKTFQSFLKKIVDAFIIPWIRQRHGIVYGYELEERFEKLALKAASFENAWSFFQDVYGDGDSLLKQCLQNDGAYLYFADKKCKQDFRLVEKRALSYFYNEKAAYPIDQLIGYIAKELTRSWQGFPDGFINKTLRSSSFFSFKKEKNTLIIFLR